MLDTPVTAFPPHYQLQLFAHRPQASSKVREQLPIYTRQTLSIRKRPSFTGDVPRPPNRGSHQVAHGWFKTIHGPAEREPQTRPRFKTTLALDFAPKPALNHLGTACTISDRTRLRKVPLDIEPGSGHVCLG